jgi:hypothetical protein
MSKKSRTAPVAESLRQTADRVVGEWREKVAEQHDAEEKFRKLKGEFNSRVSLNSQRVELIPLKEAEIAKLEAEVLARELQALATVVLDSVEIAEGDTHAVARDAQALYADLVAFDAHESEHLEGMRRAQRERAARIALAQTSASELKARRKASDEPPPTPLPYLQPDPTSALKNFLAGSPLEKSRPLAAVRIDQLKKEVAEMCADLELDERLRESNARGEKTSRDSYASSELIEDLAAAYRKRMGGV